MGSDKSVPTKSRGSPFSASRLPIEVTGTIQFDARTSAPEGATRTPSPHGNEWHRRRGALRRLRASPTVREVSAAERVPPTDAVPPTASARAVPASMAAVWEGLLALVAP